MSRIERTKAVNHGFIRHMFDFYRKVYNHYFGDEMDERLERWVISNSPIVTADFIDDTMDEFNWNFELLLKNRSIEFWLFEKYFETHILNKVDISSFVYYQSKNMTLEFAERYKEYLYHPIFIWSNEYVISIYSKKSLEWIEENINFIDINNLVYNRNLTTEFIIKHKKILTAHLIVFKYMSLSDLELCYENDVYIPAYSEYIAKNKNISIEFALRHNIHLKHPDLLMKNPAVNHRDPMFHKLLYSLRDRSSKLDYLANPNANFEWIVEAIENGTMDLNYSSLFSDISLIALNPSLSYSQIIHIYDKFENNKYSITLLSRCKNITIQDFYNTFDNCMLSRSTLSLEMDLTDILVNNNFYAERELYYKKHIACYKIQQYWNLVTTDPMYKLCRNRLERDYEKIYNNKIDLCIT